MLKGTDYSRKNDHKNEPKALANAGAFFVLTPSFYRPSTYLECPSSQASMSSGTVSVR